MKTIFILFLISISAIGAPTSWNTNQFTQTGLGSIKNNALTTNLFVQTNLTIRGNGDSPSSAPSLIFTNATGETNHAIVSLDNGGGDSILNIGTLSDNGSTLTYFLRFLLDGNAEFSGTVAGSDPLDNDNFATKGYSDTTYGPPVTAGTDGQFWWSFGGATGWSTNGGFIGNLNAERLTAGLVPDARLDGVSINANSIASSNGFTSVSATQGGYVGLGNTNNALMFSFGATNVSTNWHFMPHPSVLPVSGLMYYRLSQGTNLTMQPITNDTSGYVLTSTGTGDANAPTFQPAAGGGGVEGLSSRRGRFEVFDDLFYGTLSTSVGQGSMGLVRASSGTGASSSGSAPTSSSGTNCPGCIQLQTGTTTTGYAGIHTLNFTTGATQLGGGPVWTNEWRIYFATLPDATDPYIARVGLMDTATGTDGTDGLFMRVSTNNANFIFASRANSSQSTVTNTTAVTAGQWYRIQITVNSDASIATFKVDDADAVTLSENIPSGANRTQGLGAWITKDGTGTADRSMFLDYFYLRSDVSR